MGGGRFLGPQGQQLTSPDGGRSSFSTPVPSPGSSLARSTPTSLRLRGAGPTGRWSAEPCGDFRRLPLGDYNSHNAPPTWTLCFILPLPLVFLEPQPLSTDYGLVFSESALIGYLCCAV